ncbi:MAG: FAD-binding oxidoreductase, partial [Gemmatimonadaceae bacterium]
MSTAEVVRVVRECADTRTSLRICANSNWLDAGRPVQADKTLSLGDDSGVVSYVPGDLTLTARAGTSLAEIQRATKEHDQWLPLDPYGSDEGSIGATIATASAGPLASSFGLPRDLVLGIEFVNGRGDVIRAGGKVVKNVAGFDLSRLVTGSWGTLGVITEVTLRLYARPKADRTFVARLPGNEKDLRTILFSFRNSGLAPYAMELLSATASKALRVGDAPLCLLRFGGNAALVDVQARAASTLMRVEEAPTEIWDRLRLLETHADEVIRVSALPVQFFSAASKMLSEQLPGVFMYISILRGVMRVLTLPS